MSEARADMFRNRLTKVFRHLSKQARRSQVVCYRLYDHDLPEFPFCIEHYGDFLYIAEYRRNHHLSEADHEAWFDRSMAIVAEVTGMPVSSMFFRLRGRKAGRTGQYTRVASEGSVREVSEGGLRFLVNGTDYLDTGLFLDHRITRSMVREGSAEKKVLNLFCYTGSFSVYAAAGGASQVVSVDLSNTYLDWARRNMVLNGFSDEDRYRFVPADVKQVLPTMKGQDFDLVVMDPPTFSNSKRMNDFLDVQRDHPLLINQAMDAMRPGGLLYFSTNLKTFRFDASAILCRDWKDITPATTPFDFAGRLARFCYRIIS